MLIRKLRRFAHIEPPISGDFCVFLNYSDGYEEKFKQRDFLQIACFDPGVINVGCRIERRYLLTDTKETTKINDLGGFSRIETVFQKRLQTAKSARPKPKKKTDLDSAPIVMKPFPKGRGRGAQRRQHGKVKRVPRVLEMTKDQHYYTNLSRIIYDLRKELRECDYILIEAQLSKNPEACRVSQHIISTIMAVVNGCCELDSNGVAATRPLIVEVAPHFKSRYFGVRGPKGQDLKKWAIVKAFSLLERNGDTTALEIIKKDRKKDDQCDVVLYCEAWAGIIFDQVKANLVRQKTENEQSSDSEDRDSEDRDSSDSDSD